MQQVYVHSGGGFGDHLSRYFGWPEWRTLKYIKSQDIHIKAILYSANSSVPEFYAFNPYLDDIIFFNVHDNANGEYRLKDLSNGLKHISETEEYRELMTKIEEQRIVLDEPEIFLSKDEEERWEEIQNTGDYICINPFAGQKERLTLDPKHTVQLIDKIIDTLHKKVVLLGGSWTLTDRHSNLQKKDEQFIEERFEYEREGLFNLVGKTSTRLSTKLSMNACGYIGNYTGPTLAAWIAKVKTICCVAPAVTAAGNAPYTVASWPVLWDLPFNKTIFFSEKTNQEQVINDILKWLQQGLPCNRCTLWAPWGIRKIY